jgi:exonuclease VII small subunit
MDLQKGAFHIEQSFSKWWAGKTLMKSCDENIGLYLDAITDFQK